MAGTNGGTVEIRAEQLPPGYVVFGLAGGKAAPEKLPPMLSKAVSEWCRVRPEARVRAVLPVIQDGQLVGVHLWYAA